MQEKGLRKMKKMYTDYATASSWGGINLILCNNLPEIDPECAGDAYSTLYDEENDEYPEIFQWYLTDLSEWSKNWQEKTFDIKYVYSSVLDLYVMPVTHWGTSWTAVSCEVKRSDWFEVNQDKVFKY